VRLNLATPGRDIAEAIAQPAAAASPDQRARAFVTALGGAGNLTEVAACTTRLRMLLVDNAAIDEAALKRLGARGIIRSSSNGLQVVLGPVADQVAGEIRAALRSNSPDTLALLGALGGRNNVVGLETSAGRLLLRIANLGSVDESALERLGIRGTAQSGPDSLQLLIAGPPEEWLTPLRRLLG
jgi:PTS system N-acetylglucosamine-specific IIC component